MPDTTHYTSCLRIERTDGFVICLTELDKDLIINDSEIDLSVGDQTYLSAAGYTPTNIQSTSDNAVNNADVEGVLSSIGVQREDIIGGRYDFAKLHIFLWDWENNVLVKKLGSGHWGEVTLKDGSYTAEFRSLSQQLQQTIGRTYNPECDEQLGGPRCGITLGLFPKEDGIVAAETSRTIFEDTNKVDATGFYDGMILTWTSGLNDTVSSIIETFVNGVFTLQDDMPEYISYNDAYTIDSATYSGSVNVYGASYDTIVDTSITGIEGYVGMYVEFTSGLNNGEFRQISVNSLGILVLITGLDNPILFEDKYIIINMTTDTHMAIGEITSVTDSRIFTASLITNTVLSDDYFTYGKLKFVSGANDNLHMEVKGYVDATKGFSLFLPMPFQIAIGDKFQVFAGCDKQLVTCKDKFLNHINFQGFPFIPGQDQITKFGGQ